MSRYNVVTRPGMRHKTVGRYATTRRGQHSARYGQACAATRSGVSCYTPMPTPTIRLGESYDTAGVSPRHDVWCTMTRLLARGLGAVGAQLGFRVCTLCTQPRFDSVHCSESLFGTLFTSTVHEVFKKIKIKIK